MELAQLIYDIFKDEPQTVNVNKGQSNAKQSKGT